MDLYVIYTSDNGFHIGQHRLPTGKRCQYEEDSNVPLIVRGPGVPKGATSNHVTSHTDLTPSIVHWAGASSSIEFDGSPLPIDRVTVDTRATFEHNAAEFWGYDRDDLPVSKQGPDNTYKAIGVIGQEYSLYYSVWCDGSQEVYDMTVSSHNNFILPRLTHLDRHYPDEQSP
jgi:N-acetylglucosamine-6-sulfatase